MTVRHENAGLMRDSRAWEVQPGAAAFCMSVAGGFGKAQIWSQ